MGSSGLRVASVQPVMWSAGRRMCSRLTGVRATDTGRVHFAAAPCIGPMDVGTTERSAVGDGGSASSCRRVSRWHFRSRHRLRGVRDDARLLRIAPRHLCYTTLAVESRRIRRISRPLDLGPRFQDALRVVARYATRSSGDQEGVADGPPALLGSSARAVVPGCGSGRPRCRNTIATPNQHRSRCGGAGLFRQPLSALPLPRWRTASLSARRVSEASEGGSGDGELQPWLVAAPFPTMKALRHQACGNVRLPPSGRP